MPEQVDKVRGSQHATKDPFSAVPKNGGKHPCSFSCEPQSIGVSHTLLTVLHEGIESQSERDVNITGKHF